MRARVERIKNHHFRFHVINFQGDIDVPAEGQSAKEIGGPSPKELALAALCGCTGTDVIDLMAKFKVTYDSLTIEARADLTEKHPKIFSKISLSYTVGGAQGDLAMISEAVKRSTHQYSGMAFMLSRSCPIEYVVMVDSAETAKGVVDFSGTGSR